MSVHALDLGIDAVHVPSIESPRRKMAEISSAKRKSLPSNDFALPAQRKYPIHDAAHVRNAAARLEEEKNAGKISGADYSKAKRAIARAERKFGIAGAGKKLHVRAQLGEGGHLHIRHMSDGSEIVTLGGIELRGADDKPVWIQLAKPGMFKGHPAGPFELNARIFDQIVTNFKATANHKVPIDFEHASEADPTSGSIPTDGAPAQGWIIDMKVEGGNLWGLVEWGTKARDYIRAGQYRFFSPAIRFNSRDRVTGEPVGARMSSGALTNNPFLDGMKPLAAKDTADATAMRFAYSSAETMPAIRRGLRLSPMASVAECSAELERVCDAYAAGGGADIHGMPVQDRIRALREELRSPMTASIEDILEQIEELLDAAFDEATPTDSSGVPVSADLDDDTDDDSGDTTMSDQKDDVTKLSDKVATLTLELKDEKSKRETAEESLKKANERIGELEKGLLTDRVEEAFATWKEKKSLTDDDKEAMMIVLKASPEKFDKLYPRVDADKRALLRDVTPPERRESPTETDASPEGETFTQTVTRLMKADKTLSYEGAQRKAQKVRAQKK